MHKVWLIIKREYKVGVISKGFLISTIAIPAVFGGMIVFEALVAKSRPVRPFKIAILDGTGSLGSTFDRELSKNKLPSGQPEFQVIKLMENASPQGPDQPRLMAMTRDRQIDAYLWIPPQVARGAQPQLMENSPTILNSLSDLRRAFNSAVISFRLKADGIDSQRADQLTSSVKIEVTRLTGHGETREKGQVYIVAFVMATLLYGALLMYGISTMRSVLEEKTTRTMEVLISSVRPVQLMAGKILGVAAVGLTQFLIWGTSAAVLAAYGLTMSRALGQGNSTLNLHIPASLIAYVIVYFLGGYLLYASVYAAVGAVVSDQNDAQQIQIPISLMLVASFLLFNVVGRDPNSRTSVILTLIPVFSPILMVFRIALETPPFWQIALSLVILFLTTAGVVYVSARIYRVGVLMYGKRPSLVEILRWLRYS